MDETRPDTHDLKALDALADVVQSDVHFRCRLDAVLTPAERSSLSLTTFGLNIDSETTLSLTA